MADMCFCGPGEFDHLANKAINTFKELLADPTNIQDEVYIIIVGDAKKTPSQVRWQRDVREKLTQPEEYYSKKRARDDRHKVNRKKKKIGPKDENSQSVDGVQQPSSIKSSCVDGPQGFITVQPHCSYGED
jgi:undecaprenyl pyrophosphate synthase